MYTLDLCRICLSALINRDIRDLKISENDNSESYVEILLFCLDIQVVENSAFSTKLCEKCYEAIINYHKFKTLALRNDRYLKTIKPSTVKLEQIIKDETEFELESDDGSPEVVIDKFEVEDDMNYNYFHIYSADTDLLSSVINTEEVDKEQSPVDVNKISAEGARQDENLNPSIQDSSEPRVADKEAPSSAKLPNDKVTDTKRSAKKRKTSGSTNISKRNFKETTQCARHDENLNPSIQDSSEKQLTEQHHPVSEPQREIEKPSKSPVPLLRDCGTTSSSSSPRVADKEAPSSAKLPNDNVTDIKTSVKKRKAHGSTNISKRNLNKTPYARHDENLNPIIQDSSEKTEQHHPVSEPQREIEKPSKSPVPLLRDCGTTSSSSSPRVADKEAPSSAKLSNDNVTDIKTSVKKRKAHGSTNTSKRNLKKTTQCARHDENLNPSIQDSSEKTEKHHPVSEPQREIEKPSKSPVPLLRDCGTTSSSSSPRVADKEAPSSAKLPNDNVTDIKTSQKKRKNVTSINPPEKKRKTRSNTESTERNLKMLQCEICDKKYTQKNLKTHIRIHAVGKFACELCDKKFKWKHLLDRHIRIHTGDIPYTCEICNKNFIWKHHLESHIRTHTGERPYACKICDKKFAVKGTLKKHIRVHTGEKPYACEICLKTFTERGGLQKHIRIHTGEKFACELCDKKFTVKGILKEHIRIHTGEQRYVCEICDKKFTHKTQLKIHLAIHTGEKPYSCVMCNKKFVQKVQLKNHIKTHTDEKPYTCDICDKRFIQKAQMKIHIMRHTGLKSYACEICNKKFIQRAQLRTHIITHTGKKPYACEMCHKTFTEKGSLQRHIRILHTGEKRHTSTTTTTTYDCDICDKKFSNRGNLHTHIRLHTGEKPYVCEICDKKFSDGGNFQRHIRMHTGKKYYACATCDKKFTTKHSLKTHISNIRIHS